MLLTTDTVRLFLNLDELFGYSIMRPRSLSTLAVSVPENMSA